MDSTGHDAEARNQTVFSVTDDLIIRTALVSVYDKTDLAPFAKKLVAHEVTIISTGGTLKALRAEGIGVIPLESITHFPEMLDGRVKTLNSRVFGGILADRSNAEHMRTLSAHEIKEIDMVVCNFYNFGELALQRGVAEAALLERVDIGGPSMVMAGAKNFGSVCVVPSIEDYERVADELDRTGGKISYATRHDLMIASVRIEADYRGLIANVLEGRTTETTKQPSKSRRRGS